MGLLLAVFSLCALVPCSLLVVLCCFRQVSGSVWSFRSFFPCLVVVWVGVGCFPLFLAVVLLVSGSFLLFLIGVGSVGSFLVVFLVRR